MRIRAKLILGFMLIAIILGAVGYVGIAVNGSIMEQGEVVRELTEFTAIVNKLQLNAIELATTTSLDDYNRSISTINGLRGDFDFLYLKNEETLRGIGGFEGFDLDIAEFTRISDEIIEIHREKLVQSEIFAEKFTEEKSMLYSLRGALFALNDTKLTETVGMMQYYGKETIYQYRDQEHWDIWLENIAQVKNRLTEMELVQNEKNSFLGDLETYRQTAAAIGQIALRQKEIEDQENAKIIKLREITKKMGENSKILTENISSQTRELAKNASSLLIGIALAGFMLSLGLGFFISNSISKPISKLSEVAVRLGRGELGARANVESNDEVGELAGTFNEMAGKLEDAIGNDEEYSAKLEKKAAELEKARVETIKALEDVTRAKGDFEKANKKLMGLDKAKDDFLNMISHEVITPMVPIKGYAELLHKERMGKLNSKQLETVAIIERNIDRLSRIVNDVLEFSRINAGKLALNVENIKIDSMVIDAVNDMRPLARQKKVELKTGKLGGLPMLVADERRIKQVIDNLTKNAIKFTPEGGKVTISAEDKKEEVVVAIKDTGIGISKTDMEKIFAKYYQVKASKKRSGPGLGLGLAICKGIVEAHRGRLWAESVKGKGSTFYFTLPVDQSLR